jgi:hypothetical protein
MPSEDAAARISCNCRRRVAVEGITEFSRRRCAGTHPQDRYAWMVERNVRRTGLGNRRAVRAVWYTPRYLVTVKWSNSDRNAVGAFVRAIQKQFAEDR